MTLALAPILCGAVITACSSSDNYPPLIGGPFDGGYGGGGQHGGDGGGGGGGSSNACFNQGGMCTAAGNLCPVELHGVSCGTGSVQICCTGYNDAGGPDVVFDVGNQ